jgi:hypothetical protein
MKYSNLIDEVYEMKFKIEKKGQSQFIFWPLNVVKLVIVLGLVSFEDL